MNANGNPTTINTNNNNIGVGAGQNINDGTANNETTGGELIRLDLLNHVVTDAAMATGFGWTDHFTATDIQATSQLYTRRRSDQFRGCRDLG